MIREVIKETEQSLRAEHKLQAPSRAESNGGTPFHVPFRLPFLPIALVSLLNRAVTQRSNTLKPQSSSVITCCQLRISACQQISC